MSRKTALVFAVTLAAFAAIFTGCRQQAQTPEDVLRDWYGRRLFISEDGGYYWSSSPGNINPDTGMPWMTIPLVGLFELEGGDGSEVSFAVVNEEVSVSDSEVAVVWQTGAENISAAVDYWIEIYLDGEWYCLNADVATFGERSELVPGVEREDAFALDYYYPVGKYRLIGDYSPTGEPTEHKYLSAEFEIAG